MHGAGRILFDVTKETMYKERRKGLLACRNEQMGRLEERETKSQEAN